MDTITARLEVLSICVCAIARSLSSAQQGQAAGEARDRIHALLGEYGAELSADADEAIAVQTREVLTALEG